MSASPPPSPHDPAAVRASMAEKVEAIGRAEERVREVAPRLAAFGLGWLGEAVLAALSFGRTAAALAAVYAERVAAAEARTARAERELADATTAATSGPIAENAAAIAQAADSLERTIPSLPLKGPRGTEALQHLRATLALGRAFVEAQARMAGQLAAKDARIAGLERALAEARARGAANQNEVG